MNCSSWLALMKSIDGAPMSTPAGGQHDVGHQAGGEHRVDDAVAQRRGHHREGLLDLGAAEDEDAGPRRLLAQAREVLVLPLEEAAHGRRQQLLEADQGGLRAVRRGEGVADVEVGERRQLAHHERLRLLLRRQLELRLEERELLAQKRTLSSSRISPSASAATASRAAGPQTSSMKPTGRPISSLRTAACGSVEA